MGYRNCWYGEIKEIAGKYNVNMDEVTNIKKSEWKKMVKRWIRESIEKQSKEKEVQYRKLRHQKHQKYGRQRYLEEVGIKAATEMMKTKLEMWDIGRIQAMKGIVGVVT